MASTEQKISKLGAAGTRHITLTITEILELVRKPGSAQARVSLWQYTTLHC